VKANDALSIASLRRQLYLVRYKAKVPFVETKSTEPSKRSLKYKLAVCGETFRISVILILSGGFLPADWDCIILVGIYARKKEGKLKNFLAASSFAKASEDMEDAENAEEKGGEFGLVVFLTEASFKASFGT